MQTDQQFKYVAAGPVINPETHYTHDIEEEGGMFVRKNAVKVHFVRS